MTEVVKRDGRREAFIPGKIVVSAVKSGAPPNLVRKIAQDIGRTAGETITAGAIQDIAVPALRPADPARERN